jgi:hypothetical protein
VPLCPPQIPLDWSWCKPRLLRWEAGVKPPEPLHSRVFSVCATHNSVHHWVQFSAQSVTYHLIQWCIQNHHPAMHLTSVKPTEIMFWKLKIVMNQVHIVSHLHYVPMGTATKMSKCQTVPMIERHFFPTFNSYSSIISNSTQQLKDIQKQIK